MDLLDAWSRFWDDPVAAFASILTPSVPVTAGGGADPFRAGVDNTPSAALYAVFGSGGDDLTSSRVRASGVDPVNGQLISPTFSDAAAARGYKSGDGQAFIDATAKDVRSQYDKDYQRSLDSISLFPSFLPDGPGSGLTHSPWLWVLVVLVIAFVLIKVVE